MLNADEPLAVLRSDAVVGIEKAANPVIFGTRLRHIKLVNGVLHAAKVVDGDQIVRVRIILPIHSEHHMLMRRIHPMCIPEGERLVLVSRRVHREILAVREV